MQVVVKPINPGDVAQGSNMKRAPRAELKENQHNKLGKEGEDWGTQRCLRVNDAKSELIRALKEKGWKTC